MNNMIRAAKDAGKHVVLAGCVPQAQPGGKTMEDLSVVGVSFWTAFAAHPFSDVCLDTITALDVAIICVCSCSVENLGNQRI